MDGKELMKLKEKIENDEKELERQQGILDNLTAKMCDEGFNSEEQLEKELKRINQQIEEAEENLQKLMEQIEARLNDMEE